MVASEYNPIDHLCTGTNCDIVLIIDDITIITTANFTPTQFIYLPNVDIPEYNYSGIHSEVGAYFVASDSILAGQMFAHYSSLLEDPETKLMFKGGQYKY